MTATVTEHDPEWLPQDFAEMLAWQQFDDDMCTGCGQPRTESMAPGADNDYTGRPLQCHACRAAHRAVDGWSGDELRGIYLTAVRDDG